MVSSYKKVYSNKSASRANWDCPRSLREENAHTPSSELEDEHCDAREADNPPVLIIQDSEKG